MPNVASHSQSDSRVPDLLKIIGSVVAPTSLFTGLLFYFGQAHVYWFFRYFGLDSSLLGFTVQDYLVRSIDALFVPLIVLMSVGLVMIAGHVALRTRLLGALSPPLLRIVVIAAALAGLALFAVGAAGIFYDTIFEFHLLVSPVSLALGVGLLAYAAHWNRTRRLMAKDAPSEMLRPPWVAVVEGVAVFILIGLSFFWAATDYAAAVGRARARQFASQLEASPDVVVYSAQDLQLEAPGVRAISCRGANAAYRFQYQGLKLMLRSDGQYFLLPAKWSHARGVAVVIPEGDSIRLEFMPPGVAGPASPRRQETSC